jgi:hypothetical protein
MATVTAVVQNVQIERGNDDARDAAIGNLKRATIYFDNGGVAVTGVSSVDTLDLAMATAIQNKVRNGKTVTVRTAAISQALTTQTTAGVEVTHAGFITAVSSSSVSLTPKSDGYVTGSTSSNIGASLAVVRPYAIVCAYTEA